MNSAVETIRADLDTATADAEAASKAHQVAALAAREGTIDPSDLKKAAKALDGANQRAAELNAALTAAEEREAREREEAEAAARAQRAEDMQRRIQAAHEAAKLWDTAADALVAATTAYSDAIKEVYAAHPDLGTTQQFEHARKMMMRILGNRLSGFVGERYRDLGFHGHMTTLASITQPIVKP